MIFTTLVARFSAKHVGSATWAYPLLISCAVSLILLARAMINSASATVPFRPVSPSPPAPAFALPRALEPRADYRPLFRWQVPLPSSGPSSRVHTTDSSVRTATDITGLDEIIVPVHGTREVRVDYDDDDDNDAVRVAQYDEGEEGGSANVRSALRHRGRAGGAGTSVDSSAVRGGVAGAESSTPPTRRIYTGRRPERIDRMRKTQTARSQGTAGIGVTSTSAAAAAASGSSSPPTLVSAAIGADDDAERSALVLVCERAGLSADVADRLFAEAITTRVLSGLLVSDPARARTVLAEAG